MRNVLGHLDTGSDPYAGGDLPNARRLGAVIWVISSAFTALLLAFSPPDAVIGAAGWPVVGVALIAGLLSARRLLATDSRTGWDELLLMGYLAIAQLALLHWLTGGGPSAFPELSLLVAASAGAIHPPRRVLGIVAAIAVVSAAPLVYGGWDAAFAAQTLTRVLLDAALAYVASVLMLDVRAQRVMLQDEARGDALTGLANRRAFEETLAAEMSRARRSGSALSLVVADLDHFKAVNDQHGHLEGDALLRQTAD